MVKYDFSKAPSTKARILAAVRHFNAISIKNIAGYCGLSIPIVTRYVESMLADRLLKEQASTVLTVGRKPSLFSLNADYGYIVGVELGLLHKAKVGVFSFDGTMIASTTLAYAPQWDAKIIIESVMKTIEEQLSACLPDRKRLLYIVIGNPGVVEPATGTMEVAAEFATWSSLPLRQIFMQRFNLPVEVINDVNLSAIGEKEFGIGKGYDNFILVRQSPGLKAGIILNNRLYQGETHAAGEIGNCILFFNENDTIVRKNAESCLCMPALFEQIASKLHDDVDDIFYSITGGNPQNVSVDTIIKALGTPSYVNDLIAESGKMLGFVLLNVVATLDIALIILSGDVVKFNNYYIKPIRDVLSEGLIYHTPAVLTSSLGDDVALYGAFAVGQERILDTIP